MVENDSIRQTDARGESRDPDLGWMKFPRIAEAFQPTPEKTIALLMQKHEFYQKQANSALSAERTNARIIAAGYARVGALLGELETARLEYIKRGAKKPSNVQQNQMEIKGRGHGKF